MLVWESGSVDIRAEEALAPHADDDIGRERNEAADWLRDRLRAGAVPSSELRREAKINGIAWRTLQRAKSKIGARSFKNGQSGWSWGMQERQLPLS